jgi:hypothetical protein
MMGFMGIVSLLWMLAAILTVAGVVLLIVWAISETGGVGEGEAVQILRSRYARGDIDEGQFAAARATLGGPAPTARRRRLLVLGVSFLLAGLLLGLVASSSLMGGMMGPPMMRMLEPSPTQSP